MDNESTDGTQELIEKWQAEADFPIRYIRHANRGHHGSSNVGFRKPAVSCSSPLTPMTERCRRPWNASRRSGTTSRQIERHRYSGVTALAIDENGAPTGDEYPSDILDSNATEVYYRYKVLGEKWGFQRTDVMRSTPTRPSRATPG